MGGLKVQKDSAPNKRSKKKVKEGRKSEETKVFPKNLNRPHIVTEEYI